MEIKCRNLCENKHENVHFVRNSNCGNNSKRLLHKYRSLCVLFKLIANLFLSVFCSHKVISINYEMKDIALHMKNGNVSLSV